MCPIILNTGTSTYLLTKYLAKMSTSLANSECHVKKMSSKCTENAIQKIQKIYMSSEYKRTSSKNIFYYFETYLRISMNDEMHLQLMSL